MQPKLTLEQITALLKQRLREGQMIASCREHQLKSWIGSVGALVGHVFGGSSEEYKNFTLIPELSLKERIDEEKLGALSATVHTPSRRILAGKLGELKALIEIIEMGGNHSANGADLTFVKKTNTVVKETRTSGLAKLSLADVQMPVVHANEAKTGGLREVSLANLQTLPDAQSPIENANKNVFLVHGHDHGTLQTVARFIEKLNLTPIILHEKANKGQTIIEKFEKHSGVSYAIVLLTPDDQGGEKSCPSEKLKPRARQNVILELGYFMAKLGRERVSSLYVEGVEIPSDYQGVLFTPLDSHDSWHLKLAKELKAAGFDIDLNSLAK